MAVALVELAAVPIEQSAEANGIDQKSETTNDLRHPQLGQPGRRLKLYLL